ncbi:VWA domain-containing protein [bacterium]|nr:VWA domain-containing protein [bacterium]
MSLYGRRIKYRLRSSFSISIILHIIFLLVLLFYPRKYTAIRQDVSIPVDWIENVPKPELKRKEQLKQPIEKQNNPERRVGREAANKLQSQFDINEVIKRSKRIPQKNVEINKSEDAKFIPWVMSDADLPDSEASNISRLVSSNGPTDGDGEVTGRMRVKGRGGGLWIVESYGKGDGDGSGDGGSGILGIPEGWDKISDRFGMIDFLKELSGPQQVAYCLDVSASMQAAGLKKLDLAKDAIHDSLWMLKDTDSFNIITFAGVTVQMNNQMLPANVQNTKKASKYLEKFTPTSIANNRGTDLLGAIKLALKSNPSVIVLITDGLPAGSAVKNRQIETNPGNIIKAVQEQNVNHASIYVVGLEITLKESPGASLLIALAEDNNGRTKLISDEQLVEYGEQLAEFTE